MSLDEIDEEIGYLIRDIEFMEEILEAKKKRLKELIYEKSKQPQSI